MSDSGDRELDKQRERDRVLCPYCRDNIVPDGSSTGLCDDCEEDSNEPNDYEGDF